MRSFSLGFLMVPVCSFALVACGDDSSATGGGGSTTTSANGGGGSTSSGDILTEFCNAQIEYEEECDPGNVDTLSECLADEDTQCFGNFREDVQQPLIDCLAALSCNQGDDDCYYDTGLANPVPGQEDYIADCAAKAEQCESFSEDFCFVTVLKEEAYTALNACVALECEAVGDCIDEALSPICPAG